jgi:hypothetical protein
MTAALPDHSKQQVILALPCRHCPQDADDTSCSGPGSHPSAVDEEFLEQFGTLPHLACCYVWSNHPLTFLQAAAAPPAPFFGSRNPNLPQLPRSVCRRCDGSKTVTASRAHMQRSNCMRRLNAKESCLLAQARIQRSSKARLSRLRDCLRQHSRRSLRRNPSSKAADHSPIADGENGIERTVRLHASNAQTSTSVLSPSC